MSKKQDECTYRHHNGYNCAQAVLCTYAPQLGIDEETAFRMAEGLGLGMGCMEGTCGAVNAACLLAGLKNSNGDMEHPTSKGATLKLSKQIMTAFLEKAGATRCRDLKGIDTGVILHSCSDCVKDAAAIAEEVLDLAGEDTE